MPVVPRRLRRLAFAALACVLLAPAAASAQPGRAWKALMVAGSPALAAYDDAVSDLAERLRARGVATIAQALVRPGGDAPGRFGATRPGLLDAAASIERQDGACLFFATGHGSRDGFHLDIEPRRRVLRPRELARLLDRLCGDAPTVAIVSACDAAVFLDERLRRPNRILIAASAVGRVSYGAKLAERHVNFDRCLLQAIDDGARSWQSVYERTVRCVAERERWLGVAASKPQAFFGDQVRSLEVPRMADLANNLKR